MVGASIVTIDGNLLDDSILYTVNVTQELNAHWWCHLECRQVAEHPLEVEAMLGKSIRIATTCQDGSQVTVFFGIVIEAERTFEIWGSAGARLRAVTLSYLLDLTPRRAYYLRQSPQDVASKLTSDAGCKWNGPIEGPTLSYVQMGETDFAFILRLSDGAEKWIRPSWDGLEAHDAFSSGSTIQWRHEGGLLQFAVTGKTAPESFKGAHYDYRHMESRVSTSRDTATFYGSVAAMVNAAKRQAATLAPAYLPDRARLLGADELEPRLKQQSRRSIGGTVLCRGISREQKLKAGDEVTIDGALDANGVYGLVRVVHQWTQTGYENHFLCTPSKKYVNAAAPVVPKLAGTIPARVVDNNDPEGIARLRIQYFWQEANQTCWVRWMTPHAGADRGFFFIPEVGDEVWVMFEEGDPERPRIIGCAWNGVHKPPREELWGKDVSPNDVKRLVTKSGHRLTLSDREGKEAIVAATPNHLKMSLLENSNETGDAMLALHSDGDIFLSAPEGRIHFHSKYFSREVGSGTKDKVGSTPESAAGSHEIVLQPRTSGQNPLSMAVRLAENAKLRQSSSFHDDLQRVGLTQSDIDRMSAKEAPLGFKSIEQFDLFKAELALALVKAGLDDAEVGLKGTSTTFYSENLDKPLGHHWDADPLRLADYDLNITSQKMVGVLKSTGAELSEKYGIFSTRTVMRNFPELDKFRQKWSTQLGRDVNFVGYPKPQPRDPTEFVVREPNE